MRLLSLGSLSRPVCLYISEVRSLLVMAGICSLTLIDPDVARGTAALAGVALVVPVLARDHLPVGDHRRWRRTLSAWARLVADRPLDDCTPATGAS